jgi:hypothetical protein
LTFISTGIGEALEEKGNKVSIYKLMGTTYIEFSWEHEKQKETEDY